MWKHDHVLKQYYVMFTVECLQLYVFLVHFNNILMPNVPHTSCSSSYIQQYKIMVWTIEWWFKAEWPQYKYWVAQRKTSPVTNKRKLSLAYQVVINFETIRQQHNIPGKYCLSKDVMLWSQQIFIVMVSAETSQSRVFSISCFLNF